MIKKIFFVSTLFTLGVLAATNPVRAAVLDILGNSSFENTLGVGTNWNNDAGRGISNPTVTSAPEGSKVLRLDESGTIVGQFTFTFQTMTAKAGDRVSVTGFGREVTLDDGNDDGQVVIEFRDSVNALLASTITSLSGTDFTRFSSAATAPATTTVAVVVLRIQNGEALGASRVEFDNVQAVISSAPLQIDANPGSTSLQSGQMKMISVRVQNTTAETLTGVEIHTDATPGITIRGDEARFAGNKLGNAPGSVVFLAGSLNPGQESLLTFPIVLTSGIVPGKNYELTVFARASTGQPTETLHIKIRTQLDPLFDEGTIIGKVFNDLNQNGVQDSCVIVGTAERCTGGEKGVPWVRLMTEEGIEIVTDEEGRYHIPAVKPGRHIVKIDGHSLPEGTKFITEESYLVKTTPGILSKANFAVLIPPSKIPEQFQRDMAVMITQGLDTTHPDLGVAMDPDLLKVGIGVLERNPVFKFSMNYPEMVKSWYLEVRDELGREVWTGFGVAAPPPEVLWSGQTEGGLLIKPGLYSYQFKVEDKEGHQDWTPLYFFRVISKADPDQVNRQVEIPPIGDFNLFKDGRRSIPLIAKPTLRIVGKTNPQNKISVNSRPVPVDSDSGMFQTEFYTTAGEKDVVVTSTTPDGESTSYRQTVKVKDSTFFMVALGEEQGGFNFDRGNVETVGRDNTFKDGFYQDGRLSYAIRGKLKGKFLVKSHYDTADKRNALFTNLDPDHYYPIYGDGSTRNYEMIETGERFYMVVEWDRSHVKYGSFKTAFNDTELSTYNRTLSGLKVNYESQAATAYGDPRRGFKGFAAESTHHLADHNEFASTGGTLYYLRNRNIIQGSEKLRVEVRDKIQDISLGGRELVEGQDYEIDYADGRILLSRSLNMMAQSDTLITNDIMDGNPVFLIADYEYDGGADTFGVANRGIRGFTQMGEHIRFGATAVEEKRQNADYDMRGMDMTMKFGRNTKITAEYAETINKQTAQAVSHNGGLSFANLELIKGEHTEPRENAYLFKAETKPTKSWDVSGYLQGIDPSFSTERSSSQEATKKYGVATRYKFTDTLAFRYRYDLNEIADQLMPLADNNVIAGYESYNQHTAQLVYDDGKWMGETEYRNLNTNIPDFNRRLSGTLSEFSFLHGVSAKLGYHINDRLMPYAKVQTALSGIPNHQYGGGVRYQVTNNLFAYIEEMVGRQGDSTFFGFEQHHQQKRSYANIQMFDRGVGLPTLATTIGNSFALGERSRIFSERQHSSYRGVDGFADILGYDGRAGDHWDFQGKFERRRLSADRSRPIDVFAEQGLASNNASNVASGTVAYADGKKLRVRSMLEVRVDQDAPHMTQWVSRDSLEYKFNPDWSYLGKIDYGKSRFKDPGGTAADFMELSTGFAYRPVENDRLNALTRYSYLKDIANDAQFNGGIFSGVTADETAHIFAIDLAYDLYKWMGLVEKFAYKKAILNSNLADEIVLHNLLTVHRLNFHVTRKWDIAAEYRGLWQFDAAASLKHGPLFEIDRELYDYVRLGLGYNFTDFDDDLRKASNFRSHGPFMRLTGKF